MSDRNRRNPNERLQPDYEQGYNRQTEQFQIDRGQQFGEPTRHSYSDQGSIQMGDTYAADYDREYGERSYREPAAMSPNNTSRAPREDYRRGGGYADPAGSYSGVNPGQSHSYFRGDEYGGAEPSSPRTQEYGRHFGGYGAAPPQGYGAGGYGGAGHATDFTGGGTATRRHRHRHEERGFFDRAGDEIASWFGDEEAERRREMDHRGRGPSNYIRSDERILEDACDRLTEDRGVDARKMTVTVDKGEIALDGTVNTRWEKRRAEDCVHDISGVGHVQNNLRIEKTEMRETGDATPGTLA